MSLVGLLLGSCRTPSLRTQTVVIPPATCVLPKIPVPLGSVAPKDCDGDGPGTDICFTEDEARVVLVYVKQLQAWTMLAKNCPGTQFEQNAIPNHGSPRLAEPTKEVM
jgi:hypothetical protein